MSGKIIKGGASESSPDNLEDMGLSSLARDRQVIKGDVVDALGSADKIIQDAKQKARKIIEQAKAAEAKMLSGAHEEGYEKGLQELNDIILRFKQEYRAVLENSEKELLKLSLKVAERIIGEALTLEPSLLLDIIHNALQSIKYQKEIRIRIHPDKLNFLKENKMQLYARLGESKEIEIVGDSLVTCDGCIIDTEIGTIDARLETQLKVLEKIFLKS